MQYRILGKSDLKIPAVSFGAWAIGGWLWGGPDDANALRAMHAAIDHGITMIDTAPVYGMGHSETLVGNAVAGRRDQVLIATKCGLRWDCTDGIKHFDTTDNEGTPRTVYKNLRPTSIRWECEQSLRRLKTDYIDLYQCHWPDTTTPIADTMGVLTNLQQEGKIRFFGVSNFTVDMLSECLRSGNIVSNQPEYSALVRKIEPEILPHCKEKEIGILAYSPLAQGLLTGKVDPNREFPETDLRHKKPIFARENRSKIGTMLQEIAPIASAHGTTFAQVFLAWLLAQPGVTAVLAGARTEEQVIENAAAGELCLRADEIAFIREQVERIFPL